MAKDVIFRVQFPREPANETYALFGSMEDVQVRMECFWDPLRQVDIMKFYTYEEDLVRLRDLIDQMLDRSAEQDGKEFYG